MNDDLLEDLDAYVSQLDTEPEAPTMDDDLANRLLRRIRRQEITRTEVITVARAERDRIDAWERDRLESIDTDVASIGRLLDGYMRAVFERRKLKTLNLPNGKLSLRAPSIRVTIEDEDAFLVWAQARVAARFAKDELGPWAPGVAAEIVDRVLRTLYAEPLLRTKVEPAKDQIKRRTEVGPQRSSHEDLELLAAVIKADDAGEVVPGVLIERPTKDTFGYTTAKAPSAEPIGHDVTTQGGTDDHDRT